MGREGRLNLAGPARRRRFTQLFIRGQTETHPPPPVGKEIAARGNIKTGKLGCVIFVLYY